MNSWSRTCRNCGVQFETAKRTEHLCGPECRRARLLDQKRSAAKRYAAKYPDRVKQTFSSWYVKSRRKKTCVMCGHELKTRSWRRTFCSRLCSLPVRATQQRAYSKTARGREVHRSANTRYYSTPRGRVVRRCAGRKSDSRLERRNRQAQWRRTAHARSWLAFYQLRKRLEKRFLGNVPELSMTLAVEALKLKRELGIRF